MELKNPFALRDNSVVMIEDISIDEKGLRCNCICPSCKEPFEAKMGDIRRHHFSHSGKGCDEINAYLTGLYMLLNEFFSNGNKLKLPSAVVGFSLSDNYCLTEENVAENTWLCKKTRNKDNEIVLFDGSEVEFDSSYVKVGNDGRPSAIIAQSNGRKLAIRITPPDTVCRNGEAKRYKDYPTIEVDLSDLEDQLQQFKKADFYNYLSENEDIYRWIYNPKIQDAYPKIIEKSQQRYAAAQERKRKEWELAERKAKEDAERRAHEAAARMRMEDERRRTYEAKRNLKGQSEFLFIQNGKKTPVEFVDVEGDIYTIGTVVRCRSEIGTIIEISRLVTGMHEIEILFQDGRKNKFAIEPLIENNMLTKY